MEQCADINTRDVRLRRTHTGLHKKGYKIQVINSSDNLKHPMQKVVSVHTPMLSRLALCYCLVYHVTKYLIRTGENYLREHLL